MNTEQFCVTNKITITSQRVGSNPVNPDWKADHYQVVLHRREKGHHAQMTLFFLKGYGLNGAVPLASEVLDCLASDTSGMDNCTSFEEWARDLGYLEDSRKAEKTYKAVSSQVEKLKRFLGEDLYQELLYSVERE